MMRWRPHGGVQALPSMRDGRDMKICRIVGDDNGPKNLFTIS